MRLPAWIHRRIRRKPQVYLRPTREGWWWIGTLILLMLMGWGYTNNLCLALGVLLSAVTVVLLMEAHFNLDGVTLEGLVIEDQFAGQAAPWKLWWKAKRARSRRRLNLVWDDHIGPSGEFQLEAAKSGEARGTWTFETRKVWRNTHVVLSSTYPLGLFKAWCYQQVEIEAWVYPRMIAGSAYAQVWDEGLGAARAIESTSGDEPGDFRRYHPGDPAARIAWKALARGLPPHSKTFVEEKSERPFYRWPYGANDEAARGRLAYMIERHHRASEPWALQVYGITFPPAEGFKHHQQSLRALTEAP